MIGHAEDIATQAAAAHIIVTGNEKGGAGKSTVAMHVAIAPRGCAIRGRF
ncbi:MAG: hypothetical protein EBZ50_04615, partial [Alphaproteobacteria bacterium]|nr:hypothetical protein [Alphaproteobacteria bacterium]